MTDTAAEQARETANKIVDDAIWLHETPSSVEAERTLKHDIAAALRAAEAGARRAACIALTEIVARYEGNGDLGCPEMMAAIAALASSPAAASPWREIATLQKLVADLSCDLTDEGANWSGEGLDRMRRRVAEALPTAACPDWLLPYRPSPPASDGAK